MKSSSYLNWFRRLAVLGAVVAVGAFASTAGAVGRPPDIQDIARASPGGGRQPAAGHPGDVASRLSASVPDVFERYAADHPVRSGTGRYADVFVARPPDVQDTADSVECGRRLPTRHSSHGRSTGSTPEERARAERPACGRYFCAVSRTGRGDHRAGARPSARPAAALDPRAVDPDRRIGRLSLERLGDRDRHRDGACSPPRRLVPDEQATAAPRAACLGSPPRTDRAGRQGPLDLLATPDSPRCEARAAAGRARGFSRGAAACPGQVCARGGCRG